MTTLYSTIKQLQETSSTNDKLAIMQANSDNELFKEYMRLVTCPSISFYVTAKTLPKVKECFSRQAGFDMLDLTHCTLAFAERTMTGEAAKAAMKKWMEDQASMEDVELCRMLLLKDIRAKIGVTLVNKVWPHLCVDIPYQRCSLPDEKTLKKFNNGETFIVQTKGDGMFSCLVIEGKSQERSMYTRNGSKFPKWVGDYIARGVCATDCVFEGELLCFRDGKVLSRQEGNGILNSVMQGSDIPYGVSIEYHVWNSLTLQDWKNGSTSLTYDDRFKRTKNELSWDDTPQMRIINHWWVDTLEQAYEFNRQQLAQGLEGSIIKTRSHKWKSGTSKECLKLKVEAEVDLIWVGSVEGKGKASGMLGAMQLQSACGNVVVDVGTGMTDQHRKEYWEQREQLHGSVVTVKCNDVLTKEGSDKLSLFLPVLIEVRKDKNVADDAQRIRSIVDAAKGIV